MLTVCALVVGVSSGPAAQSNVSTAASTGEVRAADWFVPLPSIPGDRFRDVDVTDINGDGLLDIFAPAHSFEPRLYTNVGGSTFSANEITAYGLGQDPDFPRWESGAEPVMGENGLYVYRRIAAGLEQDANTSLTVAWQSTGTAAATVQLTFYSATTIESRQQATVRVVTGTDEDGREVWTATGRLQPGGSVVLRPKETGLPIDVEVGRSVPRAKINVGPALVQPASRRFTLHSKDRHGLAFADFMGDSRLDAFWAVGGNKDTAHLYEGLIDDEVFVNVNDVEVPVGPSSGVRKTTCRGYDARVVDGNGDAALDLFLGCWGQHPMLWYQDSPGHFTLDVLPNVAPKVYGTRWVDLDNDGAEELVVTAGTKVVVYRRGQGGGYTAVQSIAVTPGAGESQSVQAADYDGNGFQDVFVPASSGNVLLRNSGGVLARQGLAPLGLPTTAIGAAWVDVNSDGRMDLLAMPGGLHIQESDGTFVTPGVLAHLRPTYIASATFADLDNDGARDIVTNLDNEINYIARNVSAQGDWLQVNLTGPAGNASAVGAHVTARNGATVQRHWVGEANTALFSQGHHRLYFGFAAAASVAELTVHWPDGTTTTLTDVATDQVVNISHP